MSNLRDYVPQEARKKGNTFFVNGNPDAEYSGKILGYDLKDGFTPSTLFLETLKGRIGEVFINEKAAWLFSCKRDILKKSINKIINEPNTDLFLVLNEERDILGVVKQEGDIFKNIFDVGAYLRREINKKK